jgi:hypothetical protein
VKLEVYQEGNKVSAQEALECYDGTCRLRFDILHANVGECAQVDVGAV